jgi:Icc-related predicted phosphoesterase
MKLTFISDTHSVHEKLKLEDGDILFHCGDMSKRGEVREVNNIAHYLARQPFRHKVVIAGNHDFCFENQHREQAEKVLSDYGIIYLNDSGINIEGIKIWGSPIQPCFHDWAFNRERGQEIKKHWDLIPDDIHILITHGPPYGILDATFSGLSVGCEELLKRVTQVKPHIHAFGHIHESYGIQTMGATRFVNSCITDLRYWIRNKPIVVNL